MRAMATGQNWVFRYFNPQEESPQEVRIQFIGCTYSTICSVQNKLKLYREGAREGVP